MHPSRIFTFMDDERNRSLSRAVHFVVEMQGQVSANSGRKTADESR